MNASDLWEADGRGSLREMAGAEGLQEWLRAGPLVTSPVGTRGWDVETSPWGVGVGSTLLRSGTDMPPWGGGRTEQKKR